MTTYGITPTGFVIKPLSVIAAEIDADLRSIFGTGINTSPESNFGQLKNLFAEREALVWELKKDLYNSQYPNTAGGVSLAGIGSFSGHVWLEEVASRLLGVQLSGTPGTEVEAGTLFSVNGDASTQVASEQNVTLDGGGVATVDCTAVATGPTVIVAGTLNRIDTPIAGLESVTNPADAITGRHLETDAEFRIRRNANLQISKAGPTAAIRSAILELNADTSKPAIVHVKVFENFKLAVDARGLPPKSIELVVHQAGGVTDRDQEIADTLMLKAKPAGIEAHGDVAIDVIDSQGFTHTARLSRPVAKPIYLELDLTKTTDYPDDGDATLQAAIADWGNALGPGVDVIVYPALISQLAGVAGIRDVAARIGTSAAPTLDDNIIIDDGAGGAIEMSTWDTANIIISTV